MCLPRLPPLSAKTYLLMEATSVEAKPHQWIIDRGFHRFRQDLDSTTTTTTPNRKKPAQVSVNGKIVQVCTGTNLSNLATNQEPEKQRYRHCDGGRGGSGGGPTGLGGADCGGFAGCGGGGGAVLASGRENCGVSRLVASTCEAKLAGNSSIFKRRSMSFS
jgi:hypothetical protein